MFTGGYDLDFDPQPGGVGEDGAGVVGGSSGGIDRRDLQIYKNKMEFAHGKFRGR